MLCYPIYTHAQFLVHPFTELPNLVVALRRLRRPDALLAFQIRRRFWQIRTDRWNGGLVTVADIDCSCLKANLPIGTRSLAYHCCRITDEPTGNLLLTKNMQMQKISRCERQLPAISGFDKRWLLLWTLRSANSDNVNDIMTSQELPKKVDKRLLTNNQN